MLHGISVLIRADLGGESIDVLVRGRLDEHTCPTLAAQIAKARALGPLSMIRVDLTATDVIEASSLARLRAIVEGPQAPAHERHGSATRFLLPAEPNED